MNGATLAEQDISVPLRPILGRYLLVTSIPVYVDHQGRRYLDELWVKDLVEHFKYLHNFTLACPCRYEEPPKEAVPLEGIAVFAAIQLIDLPAPNSVVEGIGLLPKTIATLWKAVGDVDIVHMSPAGWPIPEGWWLALIAQLRQKFCLVIVESAFWRLAASSPTSLQALIRSHLFEQVNRCCVNHADLAIFTQDQYRQSLLTRFPEQGYVINASWIDEEKIIPEAESAALWHQKLSAYHENQVLKILFVGRLIPSKGVAVLLEAMKRLSGQDVSVQLDILGQGDLQEQCQRASQEIQFPLQIGLLGTVAYGTELFKLIREYHAIVIPNLSDEQPRIVYDAYSQGIPVLGSNTAGMRDCVQDGETGKLFPANDPAVLANLLKWASQHLEQLATMGSQSLKTARSLTHQEMHRRRWRILLTTLDEAQINGTRVASRKSPNVNNPNNESKHE